LLPLLFFSAITQPEEMDVLMWGRRKSFPSWLRKKREREREREGMLGFEVNIGFNWVLDFFIKFESGG
jgi:hypothetical protein